MSPSLTYFPAYLGLFLAQCLALACNAFLDIQYGSFGKEVLFWSIAFGATLRVAWRQHGQISDEGKKSQRRWLIAGALLSLFVFLPMWGMPRAALYMLAALQAGYNCTVTTRRHLHLSLLITVAMVMFATAHFRADWTMLFYLLPYVVAVVFTLVAEQVNRQASDLRQQSLSQQIVGAQGLAITAATAVILALGLVLYLVTPQLTWESLAWRWGQPTDIGRVDKQEQSGQQSGKNPAGGQGAASGENKGGRGGSESSASWPTPEEMRQAAKRPGMPFWQRRVINGMADADEWVQVTLQPILKTVQQIWQAFKQWLAEHLSQVIASIIAFALLALLFALWRLFHEAKASTWLRTRLDYVWLGVFGMNAAGERGAQQFYKAMERLFIFYDTPRSPATNTREYLRQMASVRNHMRAELSEMTQLFEDFRYGTAPTAEHQIMRMRELYRYVYCQIDV